MNQEGSQAKIIKIDEGLMKRELSDIVRDTVEEPLNKLVDAETDQRCGAGRYERSPDRIDTRAGSYERSLETKAGKVKRKVPTLRTIPFESAIIDRYKQRACSVEEARIEMYLAGVSVRRVEDMTEALWGTRASAGLISTLNKQVYEKIETWRIRKIEGRHAFV